MILVEESAERSNQKIEEEIMDELSKQLHVIPWAASIESVKVTAA